MTEPDFPTPAELGKKFAAELLDAEALFKQAIAGVNARTVFASYALYRLSLGGSRIHEHGRPMPAAAEHAAWLLYPEFGKSTVRDGARVQAAIDAIEAHAMALAATDIFSEHERDEASDQLTTHLRLHSRLVRGSSYPQQVARRIDMLLRPFDSEFSARVGIGPGRAFDILKALGTAIERSINDGRDAFVSAAEKRKALLAKKQKTEEDESELRRLAAELSTIVDAMGGEWVPTKHQLEEYVGAITDDEWSSIRRTIGLTPESRSQISSLVQIQDRPVFFLDDHRAFSVHGVQTFDALFNAFDDITRSDPQLQDRYGDTLSAWMEEEIATYLTRLFPPQAVFRNACFADPDNPRGETEADAVVVWGPFLIVVEAKGKKIHRDALRGSRPKLKQALGKNVQDAFYQGRRVIRLLERDKSIRFTERHTGRSVEVARESLRRFMPISVTLQHLSGLTTQLAVTQQLGLFKGNAYPWSLSIDDLETITRFAGSPDAFLHYIERRTAHQNIEISLSGDELDMFGHYLDNRLHPSIYEQRSEIADSAGPRMISFDGGEERFDAVYTAEWYGRSPPNEAVGVQVPTQIKSVLEELRRRDDYGARWIAFALLGLSASALAKLNAGIRDLRKTPIKGRGMTRMTARDGDVLVTVMVHAGLDEDTFRDHAIVRTRIEKYVSRAPAAVTIGINQRDSTKPFELALWVEGAWEHDDILEKVVAEDRATPRKMQLLRKGKKPGRNDPCPCGSGAKFKHCCISRVTFTRRPANQSG